MAKRVVKWTLDNVTLSMHKYIGEKGETELIVGFDLPLLFPDFADMTDIQKQIISYGIKQKLMDTGANEIADVEGKTVRAKAKFQELIDGKWSGDRVNATGAVENKRILNDVKALSKEISLTGLLMKKVAFPATFTAEDESKLQELMERASQK